MTKRWSDHVAKAYHLKLPPDLTVWLDNELWRDPGGAEFCHPQTPDELLHPEPGMIWAGFMLPDTLPLIGNQYGDWLCARVAWDGRIREVLYWCHGGGDWIPYGNTLSEALLYDAAFHVLYERRFSEVSSPERPVAEVYRWAEWGSGFLKEESAARLPRFWERPREQNGRLLEELLEAGVAKIAVRRDLILRHLESQLKQRSAPEVARQIGAEWEPDFVSWLFDTALIPELTLDDLGEHFGVPIQKLIVQDWDAAEAAALRVSQAREDLGWAFDITGWAAERRQDYGLAVERYRRGLRASAFSDDSIRFRTHWYGEGFGKFSAARLHALRDHLAPADHEDPYLQVFWQNDPESLRARVRDYWVAEAHKAEARGDQAQAYQHYYAAGWDCGLQFVRSYGELLERLAHSADQAGSPALAKIARIHLEQMM
jgi:hypothetical protein